MTARSPGAFMLSATFHALVIGLVFFFSVMASQEEKATPQVLELVAGEGDNYGATAAPALGSPEGIKLELPAAPAPKSEPLPAPAPEPSPVEPAPPPPSPVTPAPPSPKPVPAPKPVPTPKSTPAPVVTKPAPAIPNFSREIRRKQWAAEWRAKRDLAREHAAEEKRLKQEEAERRAKAAKTASSRVAHIDAEGIAKGVLGGSTENKVGGAGGKALSSAGGALTDRYFAMLKQRVLNALEKPPGVSDELVVKVVVHIWPDGRLTGAHVTKSSGSDEFDRAVIAAFGNVQMPEHPEHKSEDLEMSFRTKDAGQG